MRHEQTHRPVGAGKSSFDLVEVEGVFERLDLKEGTSLLDVACGRGEYSLAASKIVGKESIVYAVDLWEEGIAALRSHARERGLYHIRAHVSDVRERLPIRDHCVDVCLIGTALHDFVIAGIAHEALREVGRVLVPDGTLAVLEFKKINGPPGPLWRAGWRRRRSTL